MNTNQCSVTRKPINIRIYDLLQHFTMSAAQLTAFKHNVLQTVSASPRTSAIYRAIPFRASMRPFTSSITHRASSHGSSVKSKAMKNLNWLPRQNHHRFSRSGNKTTIAAAEPPSSKSLAETAALDDLIDTLMSATDANDLTKKVAENLFSFDQRFWLRLATRNDTATTDEDKERLASLAKVVMQLVDAMVKQTAEQLSDSSEILQEILKAAADERTGEWQLPLPPSQLEAMRAVMDKYEDRLDEALISNCYAWMRKASEDKLDGMVALLQKVLQVYAGRQLSAAAKVDSASDKASNASAFITQLLAEDEALWTRLLRARLLVEQDISEASFMEALQRRMESVVLGLPSGSYAQRVQAEYLKELESRAKGVFEDIAKGL